MGIIVLFTQQRVYIGMNENFLPRIKPSMLYTELFFFQVNSSQTSIYGGINYYRLAKMTGSVNWDVFL